MNSTGFLLLFEKGKCVSLKDMSQAWDLYYIVFKKISRQLPGLTSLELQYVSPKLLNCRDLELAVPGTYDPNAQLIRIASVHSNLQVRGELGSGSGAAEEGDCVGDNVEAAAA